MLELSAGKWVQLLQDWWKRVKVHHVLAKAVLDETVGSICLGSLTTGSPVGPETLQVLGLMYSLSMCKGCKLWAVPVAKRNVRSIFLQWSKERCRSMELGYPHCGSLWQLPEKESSEQQGLHHLLSLSVINTLNFYVTFILSRDDML